MAVLSISNDEIKASIATVIGVNRTPASWDAATINDVDRIIRSGRRKFFSAYDWSFLVEDYVFQTVAPYETGTVTIVDGVVTLAGGTWPTTAAQQRLVIDGTVYQVNTRTSGSVITLYDLSVDADALTTFKLYHTQYPLPSTFSAFVSPVTIEGANDYSDLRELPVLPDFSVRGFNSRANPLVRRPEAFSVSSSIADETGIPTYVIELYPLPNDVYVVSTDIRLNPGDGLEEADDDPVFHATFAELMLEAILSAAEQLYNHEEGVHSRNFQRMLPDFVRKDKVSRGARRLPPRTDNRGRGIRNYELIVGTVSLDDAV